jgi:hypothetical protein
MAFLDAGSACLWLEKVSTTLKNMQHLHFSNIELVLKFFVKGQMQGMKKMG